MQPSPYQRAILDWLIDGTGNAIVEAVAGSGKTSTLVMLANAIPSRKSAVFLAFNRAIADELKRRLPDTVKAATWHSVTGNALNRYCASKLRQKYMNWKTWTDARKCDRIFDAMYGPDDIIVRAPVMKLVSLYKAHGYLPNHDISTIRDMMLHFDVTTDSDQHTDADIIRMAQEVLSASNRDLRTVDFDDMLYMCVIFNINLDTYDYVMIDESQDTNPVQRLILRKLMGRGTRVIAVGDPCQAIYGFRGASSDAMELIRSEFDCVTLPLSISYRCPADVVRTAQAFVPHIQARDNAPSGTVATLPHFKIADFEPTDLLVCRNTAPLVQLAYRMIAARRPCKIMGRDIGKGLTSLVKKLAGRSGTLDTLPSRLEAYRERETAKALEQRNETKAQSIDDKVSSILALLDTMSPEDCADGVPGLCRVIESLFDDSARQGMTTLATVHKSKGLEAHRVFIIDPQLMPSRYAKQDWQKVQENNLQYVAITRALDTLYYVESKNVLA